MQNIKNIIFDYGNVIFPIDFQRTQQAFANLGIDNVEQFFAHKGHDTLFDDFEIGKISANEWRNGIRKKANKPDLTDNEIDSAWNSIFKEIPPVNHKILLSLKNKYQTFLLSNTNEIHYNWFTNYLHTEFNVSGNNEFFVKDYYSHILKMRKPNVEIFEFVINKHQLKPENTLFIDDSPQHLKGAELLGIKTYLMKEPDTLEKFIYQNGFL